MYFTPREKVHNARQILKKIDPFPQKITSVSSAQEETQNSALGNRNRRPQHGLQRQPGCCRRAEGGTEGLRRSPFRLSDGCARGRDRRLGHSRGFSQEGCLSPGFAAPTRESVAGGLRSGPSEAGGIENKAARRTGKGERAGEGSGAGDRATAGPELKGESGPAAARCAARTRVSTRTRAGALLR